MIPLRDDNPSKTYPVITYGLIAVNVLLFLYNGTVTVHSRNPLLGYMMVPKAVITGTNETIITDVAPWITIFSHMFLHSSWMHLIGNMLYLWIFGNNVEDTLGHFKFFVFYVLCGLGAAIAQILPNPLSPVPMLGASGAIAGVLGAYFILFPKARVMTIVMYHIVAVPASVYLGFWFLYQAFNSFVMTASRIDSGGVAFQAHLGGFIAGIILIKLMKSPKEIAKIRNKSYYRYR